MDVTVALEVRYVCTPDGSVWSPGGMARSFWERYLEVFDRVHVLARAKMAERVPDDWQRVDSSNVLVHPIPDYQGPWQFLSRYRRVRKTIDLAAIGQGAVILRVGSQICNLLERRLQARRRPYALEVIGDPWAVLAPGVVDHPLRPFLRWYLTQRLREQCTHAAAVSYVTRASLQRRYPAHVKSVSISDVELAPGAIISVGQRAPQMTTWYSSVELSPDAVVPAPGEMEGANKIHRKRPWRIVTVGALEQLYKGTDVLIEAVALCVRAGLNVTGVIVGDGKYRETLMAQAASAGLGSRIDFLGQVASGEPVRRILDASDLFAMPSRTEGLPRALVEAMARGLPCIGSAVGGIPELLEPSEMVPPGDPVALAALIRDVLANPARMASMSRRNVDVAQRYSSSALSSRRREFYAYVRDVTREWELRKVA